MADAQAEDAIMGMEQTVLFATGVVPPWTIVRDLLANHGLPVQVRMIDGQLAFPEEVPPATWRELRLSTPPGMITLRREPDRIALVIWGNADVRLREAWNALTWAFATAADGRILSGGGPRSAADFRCTAEFPAGWPT
jgi:hypothetical protein